LRRTRRRDFRLNTSEPDREADQDQRENTRNAHDLAEVDHPMNFFAPQIKTPSRQNGMPIGGGQRDLARR
jgi:hypothetical protein